MSVFPFYKLTNLPFQTVRLFYKHNGFSYLKTCKMELVNSVITEPYQNGIAGLKKEAKWKTSEKKSKSVSLRPIGICGPSGSGKSTLLKRLLKEYRDCIDFSISHTTRNPRPNEIAGKDYHFVSRSEMEAAIAKMEFLEHAEFSGNLYGTSKNAVTSIHKKGKLCIMDVEMNGVKNLRKTSLNPKFIFVKTPSIEVLEERLRSRNTESEESLQKRLSKAKDELAYGETPGNFDLIVVNDELEEAYRQLKEYLLPDIEELKKRKQH